MASNPAPWNLCFEAPDKDGAHASRRGVAARVLFLIDANVLIRAHEDYYPIDRVPQFWRWLRTGRVPAGRDSMRISCRPWLVRQAGNPTSAGNPGTKDP